VRANRPAGAALELTSADSDATRSAEINERSVDLGGSSASVMRPELAEELVNTV
jgi:hypothetical protein